MSKIMRGLRSFGRSITRQLPERPYPSDHRGACATTPNARAGSPPRFFRQPPPSDPRGRRPFASLLPHSLLAGIPA